MDFKPPRFVLLGDSSYMSFDEEDSDLKRNKIFYVCDHGGWQCKAELKDGKLFVMPFTSFTDHLEGMELVPLTVEDYARGRGLKYIVSTITETWLVDEMLPVSDISISSDVEIVNENFNELIFVESTKTVKHRDPK